MREGSGIATAKGQTEFAATASPRPAGRGRDRESSVVRSNFIEHRVQSDVKRVRMEARSNVPSAKTTPQPSLDNDEPPHGRRGRKSTLRASPSPREKLAKVRGEVGGIRPGGKWAGRQQKMRTPDVARARRGAGFQRAVSPSAQRGSCSTSYVATCRSPHQLETPVGIRSANQSPQTNIRNRTKSSYFVTDTDTRPPGALSSSH